MMQALNAGSLGRSFSLTRCNTSQEKKPRRRRTKQERKSMVESFITKYRSSHNGSFPSLNLTHKEVGGSFYTVREIMRDIIQENKVLGPGNARIKSLKFEDVLEGDKANYLSMAYGKESSISFMEHEVHTELSECEDEDSFRSLHSHQPEDCHLNDVFLSNETHHQQSSHLQQNSEVGSQSQQSLGTEELKDDAWTLLNPKKYKSLVYEDNNFESHVDSESSSIQKTEQVESPHLSFPIDSPKVIALNDHNLNNDILTDATNIVEDNHAECWTSGEDVSQESKIHFAPLAFDASHELSNSSDSSGEMLSSMESDSTNNHTPDSDLLERDGPTGFNEISENQSLVNEKVLSTPPNNTIFTSNKMESEDIMFHGSIGEISHHSPISQTSGASMSNALRTEGADVKTTLPSQKLSKVEPKAEKENKHSNPHASSSNPSETIEASRTEDNNPIWGTIKRIVASCINFFTS